MFSLFKLFFPHFFPKTKAVRTECGSLEAALYRSTSRMQAFLEENRFILFQGESPSEGPSSFAQTRVVEGGEEESNLQSNRLQMLN